MDLGELSLAEALIVLKPLTFFVLGIAVYAIFIGSWGARTCLN